MKYALIEEHLGQFPIALMCRVLSVARSGFYKWRNNAGGGRAEQQKVVVKAVLDTYDTYKARYGAPRIAKELKAAGIPCCLNNAAAILANHGLKARNGKAFKYSSSSEAMTNVAENILWRDFKAGEANTKWTSDITYIWVKDRWLLSCHGDGFIFSQNCRLGRRYNHDRRFNHNGPQHGFRIKGD